MYEVNSELQINQSRIGKHHPTYFIADVAANHDGDLQRAKELIKLAKDAGANAAKFQHFQAKGIVSDVGFKSLGGRQSHQANWKKSVFEVYQDASIDVRWTQELKETCDEAEIAFFTSPYDFQMVDHIDPYVPAYKIGSGDITWIEIVEYIAAKGKPYLLASGASTMVDVHRAVKAALAINPQLCLMQCNTNYTGSLENFKCIQLNVLKCFREMYPDLVLGLSDHTPGHATVLGAIALGARVIEKHFTDDKKRQGPDHAFSMDPTDWREMVDRSRELEFSLGTGVKQIEPNEESTAVLQRRSIRLKHSMKAGAILSRSDLEMLRPCPSDAIPPYQFEAVLGRQLRVAKAAGQHLTLNDFE